MEDWRLFLTLQLDDLEADTGGPEPLVRGLDLLQPFERHSVITWQSSVDGEPIESQLVLDVAGADPEGAREAAAELYAEARQAAQLPPAPPPTVVGYSRLRDVEPLAERLLTEAGARKLDGDHTTAVVRAQTACEVAAREEVERLLDEANLAPLKKSLPRALALRDNLTKRLLEALCGETVATQPWSKAYEAHVLRRHNAVHRGASSDEAGATASLDAARSFISWVRELQLNDPAD